MNYYNKVGIGIFFVNTAEFESLYFKNLGQQKDAKCERKGLCLEYLPVSPSVMLNISFFALFVP